MSDFVLLSDINNLVIDTLLGYYSLGKLTGLALLLIEVDSHCQAWLINCVVDGFNYMLGILSIARVVVKAGYT